MGAAVRRTKRLLAKLHRMEKTLEKIRSRVEESDGELSPWDTFRVAMMGRELQDAGELFGEIAETTGRIKTLFRQIKKPT